MYLCIMRVVETIRWLLTLLLGSMDYVTIVLGLYLESDFNQRNKKNGYLINLKTDFDRKIYVLFLCDMVV